MNPRAPMCKGLALTTWTLATMWFLVATVGAWGYAPAGLAWWSLPAFPLALLTLRWLQSAGAPPARRIVRCFGGAWLLLLLNFAFALFLGDQMPELYPLYGIVDLVTVLFPIALFVAVLVAVLHVPTMAGPTA